MTEGDFAALLGRWCRSAETVTLKDAIAHMQHALFSLMPDQQESDSDICGATVVAWNSSAILLKDSEGLLYRISTDRDGDVGINQYPDLVFNLLSVEGALDKIFNVDAVAELQRLQAEFVAEVSGKARDADRAEYERLKVQFEGVSDD